MGWVVEIDIFSKNTKAHKKISQVQKNSTYNIGSFRYKETYNTV